MSSIRKKNDFSHGAGPHFLKPWGKERKALPSRPKKSGDATDSWMPIPASAPHHQLSGGVDASDMIGYSPTMSDDYQVDDEGYTIRRPARSDENSSMQNKLSNFDSEQSSEAEGGRWGRKMFTLFFWLMTIIFCYTV